MERSILNDLLKWKDSKHRKALILKGVRQVGKTWLLREFGRRYYDSAAYFNFDENEEYKQFFETTKDVERILQNLMLASGQKIVSEKALIIFDEVQDCPKISLVWKSIPSQLARENKKFIYNVVKEGARAREYEDALQWLVDARLVHKVYRSAACSWRTRRTG